MILRRVRKGLAVEDEAMRDFGIMSTPAPRTPAAAARTPVAASTQVQMAQPVVAPADVQQVVSEALEQAVELEELQSVKNEDFVLQNVESAADDLTLYPAEVVSAGVVEIDSSSGSDSESTTSESSSSSELLPQPNQPGFKEFVPEGIDFFRHVKSGILHACKTKETVSRCRVNMGQNFRKLGRSFTFRYPKCLRCFPKDHSRIRSVDEMADAFDSVVKRARSSEAKA